MGKNFKKWACVALAVVMMASLVGCSTRENKENRISTPAMDFEVRDDGTVFVSEDWYFTLPSHDMIVKDEKGRIHFNKIVIMAEPGIPKSTFEELAREHDAKITDYRASSSLGDEYSFAFTQELTYEEIEKLSEAFENLDFIRYSFISEPMELNPRTMYKPNDQRWDTWDESNLRGNVSATAEEPEHKRDRVRLC